MLNPTDASPAAALSFPLQGPFQMSQMPSDSPLTKLMEHCNKFGTGMDNKMKLEPVKTDSLLLPTDMNAYSSYLSPQNWWVDQANWQHFYPSVTAADTFPYLSPASLGLLSSSVAAQSAAALSTQSPLATAMATQNRNPVKKVTASSASASSNSSSGNAAGGRYQAARAPNKCECPNCQELERLGSNMNDKNKVGKHNCHIAGCGKIYGKSSHLKAHLRWHSGERQVNRKQI